MSQSNWNFLLKEALKSPNFRLSNFLEKHDISIGALIDDDDTIFQCNYIDIQQLQLYNKYKLCRRWILLSLQGKSLMHHYYLLTGNYVSDMFDEITIDEYVCAYTNYCYKNYTNIPYEIFQNISYFFLQKMNLYTEKALSIIIRYHFKHMINEYIIFKYLINSNNMSLFLYAIKLYQRSYGITYYVDPIDNLKMLWLLQQNIYQLKWYNNDINSEYQKVIKNDTKTHMMLWLDPKQRMVKTPKDITLLHTKPLLTHICEFLG